MAIFDIDRFKDYDLIVAGDGVNSLVRERFKAKFQTDVEMRPNKFIWLGTTKPFRAFTFYFTENEHGLWRAHCYQYEPGLATFIVECTDETWKRAGLDQDSEDETLAYMEALFREELDGHRLLKNRSLWRSFPTIRNRRWYHENIDPSRGIGLGPEHDWSSHAADAFGMMCVAYEAPREKKTIARRVIAGQGSWMG